jgi:hypothetical protein
LAGARWWLFGFRGQLAKVRLRHASTGVPANKRAEKGEGARRHRGETYVLSFVHGTWLLTEGAGSRIFEADKPRAWCQVAMLHCNRNKVRDVDPASDTIATSPALLIGGARRIVVKVGSSLIVDPAERAARSIWLASVGADIAALRDQGKEIILVSGGPISG